MRKSQIGGIELDQLIDSLKKTPSQQQLRGGVFWSNEVLNILPSKLIISPRSRILIKFSIFFFFFFH